MAHPSFTPQGMHQEPYGYDVAYQDATSKAFLPEAWRLDNFYKNSWSPQPIAKETGEYVTEFGFDTDDDGKVNATQQQLAYDLRFENRLTAGVIWLRSVPLSQYDDKKDLRVLMRNWVNNAAGAAVDFWKVGDHIVVSTANFATKQLDEVPAKLAGLDTFASTFDVANVDQLRMSPDARQRRVKLVMVRSGLARKVGKVDFPVLLVAGVSDIPEYFDQSVVDFDKFLNQIAVGGKHGYRQLAPLANKEAPAVAAPAAPSPPAPAAETAS